jgi:mono/diheme cytochrome c family protein
VKSFIRSFLVIIALGVLAGATLIWSGLYNVAADDPHWKATLWLVNKARERSVEVHSRGSVAQPLQGERLVERGFPHFNEACRLCHGGPGLSALEFTQGLYPKPPFFPSKEVQQELSDSELYWIIKHWFKMTGMPSFGVTNSEEDLWAIVAFMRRLPTLSPGEYQAMAQRAGKS